jgi:hypothetical protein
MICVFAEPTTFDNVFKALGTAGALGTFLWTVYTWREKSRSELAAAAADAERANRTRIIEATKPFLDRQLELYTVVTRAASVVATSEEEGEVAEAAKRFLQLYSGELALVQNDEVALAMRNFRQGMRVLEASAVPAPAQAAGDQATMEPEPLVVWNMDEEREELQQLSLGLARACRRSLAKSWHVDAWANPDDAI